MNKQNCVHGIALSEKCFECARGEQKEHDTKETTRFSKAFQATIDTTLAEREATYGNFAELAEIIQALKYTMHKAPHWDKLAPDQKEALEVVVLKIGRILNGDPNYHDSWHDIIGYTKLVADRLEERE